MDDMDEASLLRVFGVHQWSELKYNVILSPACPEESFNFDTPDLPDKL
eukprot:gene16983-5239_t